MSCEHPLGQLEVDADGSGRGALPILAVRCRACDERSVGARGVRVLLEAVARDGVAVWSALESLGWVPPRPVSVPTAPVGRGACVHHLSWIRMEGGEVMRGGVADLTFRCAGCREAWPMAVGMSVYLVRVVRDREAMKAAIQKLGGVVQ